MSKITEKEENLMKINKYYEYCSPMKIHFITKAAANSAIALNMAKEMYVVQDEKALEIASLVQIIALTSRQLINICERSSIEFCESNSEKDKYE